MKYNELEMKYNEETDFTLRAGQLSYIPYITLDKYHIHHIFHTSHQIDIIFMEYDSLSRCLGGEMVDTRDSKSRAKERGCSSPLQGHNVENAP